MVPHESALTVRLHLHGFALSAWLVLFLVQAGLIAAHRRTLHMRLGIAGAILAALAVATTYAAGFEAAAHGRAQNQYIASAAYTADRTRHAIRAVCRGWNSVSQTPGDS